MCWGSKVPCFEQPYGGPDGVVKDRAHQSNSLWETENLILKAHDQLKYAYNHVKLEVDISSPFESFGLEIVATPADA